MVFNARAGISIAEIVVYFPALVLAIIVAKRHGFGRSSGWIYLILLSLIRIVGAGLQLSTVHSGGSIGIIEAYLALENIGVSPLLFATLGLLSQCADSINASSTKPFLKVVHFRLLQLVFLVPPILFAVGASTAANNASNHTAATTAPTTTKAGYVVYLVIWAILCVLTGMTLMRIMSGTIDAKWLLRAVILALPLLLARIIYSILSIFLHNRTFRLFDGSTVVYLCMAVLEEMLIVVIYLFAGCLTKKPAQRGPIAHRARRIGRRRGPIHAALKGRHSSQDELARLDSRV